VVGLEHGDDLGPERLDPLPRRTFRRRRREGVEQPADAARLDRERRDLRLPVRALAPGGMRLAPQPQAGRDIEQLYGQSM
jgi:hypothetical protein